MLSGSQWKKKLERAYLASSGAAKFDLVEFIAWLEGQSDHPMYDAYYGSPDADRARMKARGELGRRVTVQIVHDSEPPVARQIEELLRHSTQSPLTPLGS